MAKIDSLLQTMTARRASDLHLTTGHRPYLRESGDMLVLEDQHVLTEDLNRGLLYEIIPAHNLREFEAKSDTDFAYEVEGLGRFRVNVFVDHGGIGGVLRQIPSVVPTADQLGLPKIVRDFCMLTKGLVVVTGPTGSGKSTTLAAMIDLINRTRSDHIITIEDPIEFVHQPIKCLINQREVHRHTKSFASALRAALREDPDIVLVGEMRDLETIEIAIETAETGHLVFGTLHTNTAASTVDRIIDKFPSDRQNQIRTMLADSLKGVVAQTLCKKRSGGRVAAFEVLAVTLGISSNIREGKTHHIPSAMQTGRNLGMQLFSDSLMDLVEQGLITTKEAYMKAGDKESMRKRIDDAGYPLDLDALVEPHEAQAALDPAQRIRQHEQAAQQARELLKTEPDNVDALNNLAWVLGTCPEARLRNGREAVRLAERANALAGGRHPGVLDTLGAAYAESGRFDKAVETAQMGLKLAQVAGREGLGAMLKRQLAMYQAKRPYRDE